MSLHVGEDRIGAVYCGQDKIGAVYYGMDLVHQSGPDTVVIPYSPVATNARDVFRQALTDRGYDYATITEIPFILDVSQVTDLRQLFAGCANLVSVPPLETSLATQFRQMFLGCTSLVSLPEMDTSSGAGFISMCESCTALTSAEINVVSTGLGGINAIFAWCAALTDATTKLRNVPRAGGSTWGVTATNWNLGTSLTVAGVFRSD